MDANFYGFKYFYRVLIIYTQLCGLISDMIAYNLRYDSISTFMKNSSDTTYPIAVGISGEGSYLS